MCNKPLNDLDKQLLKGLLSNDVKTYLKKEDDAESDASDYDVSIREEFIKKKPNIPSIKV